MPPINETTTSTRELEPPDYNDDPEAYWALRDKYEENKKKYIEEEFVQSGPVRLLEAVYCDPCKAKVINSASKLKREEGFLYLIQWRELENKFDIFGAN